MSESLSSNGQQHEMRLEHTHASGAEEWCCPACGRRFLMSWPPSYRKIVLEAGDEYAIHTASKGGLRLSAPTVEPGHGMEGQPEDKEPNVPDELRAQIEDVLKNIDFDW